MYIYFLVPINDNFLAPRDSVMNAVNDYNPRSGTIQTAGYSSFVAATGITEVDAVLWENNPTKPAPQGNSIFLANGPINCGALGVNNIYPSDVVGWELPSLVRAHHRPVRWQLNGKTELNTLGGNAGEATDVNDVGFIVGWAENAAGNEHAFIWREGFNAGVPGNPQMLDLGTLGGAKSRALAINNNGQIVGWSLNNQGNKHAFLWTPGGTDGVATNPQMKDIHQGAFAESIAFDINDYGHIVGSVTGQAEGAFYWSADIGMVALSTLGYSARATAINNNEIIVGASASTPIADTKAVCWQFFSITDLNRITVQDADSVLTEATGINAQGDIVCNGYQSAANTRFASLLNAVRVPVYQQAHIETPLYFNWLAYRFWWHFARDFSASERERLVALMENQATDRVAHKDRIVNNAWLMTQMLQLSTGFQDDSLKAKIQRQLIGTMREDLKKLL